MKILKFLTQLKDIENKKNLVAIKPIINGFNKLILYYRNQTFNLSKLLSKFGARILVTIPKIQMLELICMHRFLLLINKYHYSH